MIGVKAVLALSRTPRCNRHVNTACSMFRDMEGSSDTGDEGHDYIADAHRLLAVLEARVARRNSVPRVEGEKGPEVVAQEEMRGLRASHVQAAEGRNAAGRRE